MDSSPEVNALQQALMHLSTSIEEVNTLTQNLCRGDLEKPLPSRHNLFVGNLKELHAVLCHLTWQTKQVANGDYQQRVSFLGDFSDAFNTMVEQLDYRERKLREQTAALTQSNDLLRGVMDAHKDWIVIDNRYTHAVIYNNRQEAHPITHCTPEALHFEKISTLEGNQAIGTNDSTLYLCTEDGRYHSVTSYPTRWNNEDAQVHYISDITQIRLEQKNLSEMAYIDQLTGVYNRRYCQIQLEQLIKDDAHFTLVMVDLNSLKPVNDTYGHAEGDSYIRTVVGMMKAGIRDNDSIFRVGGDEFVVLLKDCLLERATAMLEHIAQTITNIPSPYHMSISYGSTYVDHTNAMDMDALMTMSDEKMYHFKQEYKRNYKSMQTPTE